jgi:hypothetical protein
MSELRELVINAHGGMKRWSQVKTIGGNMSITGLMWQRKGWPEILKNVHVTAETKRQWISYNRFTEAGRRSIYQPDHVKIETLDGQVVKERHDPRAAFQGHELQTPWDDLHLAYFSGYAMWNYLNAPFLFAFPGVVSKEIEPWDENGEKMRRLQVTFPDSIATHCPEQVFHINKDGLLTRVDYMTLVNGGGLAAHYMSDHQDVDGIIVPKKRRAYPRKPDGTPARESTGVAIDMHDMRVS